MLAPLSCQQQELIDDALTHPELELRHDNIQLSKVSDAIDVSALSLALNDLVERHPQLRTSVVESNGTFRQRLSRSDMFSVRTVTHPDSTSVASLRAQIARTRYSLADIASGAPLFRATLHRVRTEIYLVLGINHLVYDGVSLEILWRDLSEYYDARIECRRTLLPDLSYTYLDYVENQENACLKELTAAVRFYRSELQSATAEPEWPAPTPSQQSRPYETDVLTLSIDPKSYAEVRRASRELRVSPFVVLLSATAMAFGCVLGQDSLLIGSDTDGRSDRRFDDVLGFFINTRLACLRHLNSTLVDVVSRVRGPWFEAARHEGVYYSHILAELGKSALLKVNMTNVFEDENDNHSVLQAGLYPIDLQLNYPHWRMAFAIWCLGRHSCRVDLYYRTDAVSLAAIQEVSDCLRLILS